MILSGVFVLAVDEISYFAGEQEAMRARLLFALSSSVVGVVVFVVSTVECPVVIALGGANPKVL